MVESNYRKFKEVWQKEIEKLEKEILDTRGVSLIYLSFERDKMWLKITSQLSQDQIFELKLLESQLRRALETARTRYILQSKSWWVRIIEGIAGIIRGAPKIYRDSEIESLGKLGRNPPS